jgi:hypothetical protein
MLSCKLFVPFLLITQAASAPQLLAWFFKAVNHDASKFSLPAACPWLDLTVISFLDLIIGALQTTVIYNHAFSPLQDMCHGLG